MLFKLHSEYQPTGDQPEAIAELVKGFKEGNQFQSTSAFKTNWFEIDGKNCFSYILAGSRERLGEDGMDKVLLTFNVTPESYEITEDSGNGRTHKVTVTYKGMTAVLYLQYTLSGK